MGKAGQKPEVVSVLWAAGSIPLTLVRSSLHLAFLASCFF